MTRSGYADGEVDECDASAFWRWCCWRGAVKRSLLGKRGQAFLVELVRALDALPEKKLFADVLVDSGKVCAMGAVALARGIDTSGVDIEDSKEVGNLFGIAEAMAAEIAHENDESRTQETPEQRWRRMRGWAARWLLPETVLQMENKKDA